MEVGFPIKKAPCRPSAAYLFLHGLYQVVFQSLGQFYLDSAARAFDGLFWHLHFPSYCHELLFTHVIAPNLLQTARPLTHTPVEVNRGQQQLGLLSRWD